MLQKWYYVHVLNTVQYNTVCLGTRERRAACYFTFHKVAGCYLFRLYQPAVLSAFILYVSNRVKVTSVCVCSKKSSETASAALPPAS